MLRKPLAIENLAGADTHHQQHRGGDAVAEKGLQKHANEEGGIGTGCVVTGEGDWK